MKTLYLIRHAKSSWSEPVLSDFERPLNHRGKHDAPFMGKLLKEQKVVADKIISSPAVRAYTTARIIASEINYPVEKIETDKNIYEASASEILNIIQEVPDSVNTLMLFGHNPGFTMLNNYLSGRQVDNIPTCGIAKIEFDVDSWKEVNINKGRLAAFEFPKKYFKHGS